MPQLSQTPTRLTSRQTMCDTDRSKSMVKIMSDMVDSVTDRLCKQITTGFLRVREEEKPLIHQQKQLKLQSPSSTVDLDRHRKIVQKFIRENKRNKSVREMRSFQLMEKNRSLDESQRKAEKEERCKLKEDRKKQAEKRIHNKYKLRKEIKEASLKSRARSSSLRDKKLLYQEKQEEFYIKVILPKIREEREILEKKKELRKPMDMAQLFQHKRLYDQSKVNEKLNRSMMRKMSKQTDWEPPEFVPESYRKLKEEEELMRKEEDIRKEYSLINTIKKQQYSRIIDQIRQKQRQLSLSRSLSASAKKSASKEKVKTKLNREQIKSKGNDYLKQLIQSNRKDKKKTKPVEVVQVPRKRVYRELDVKVARAERVQNLKKAADKRIDNIVGNSRLNDYHKVQRLRDEINKLDDAATHKMREGNDTQIRNENAVILMSSIHAKLALLRVNTARM